MHRPPRARPAAATFPAFPERSQHPACRSGLALGRTRGSSMPACRAGALRDSAARATAAAQA